MFHFPMKDKMSWMDMATYHTTFIESYQNLIARSDDDYGAELLSEMSRLNVFTLSAKAFINLTPESKNNLSDENSNQIQGLSKLLNEAKLKLINGLIEKIKNKNKQLTLITKAFIEKEQACPIVSANKERVLKTIEEVNAIDDYPIDSEALVVIKKFADLTPSSLQNDVEKIFKKRGKVQMIEANESFPCLRSAHYVVGCSTGFGYSQVAYRYLQEQGMLLILPPIAGENPTIHSIEQKVHLSSNVLSQKTRASFAEAFKTDPIPPLGYSQFQRASDENSNPSFYQTTMNWLVKQPSRSARLKMIAFDRATFSLFLTLLLKTENYLNDIEVVYVSLKEENNHQEKGEKEGFAASAYLNWMEKIKGIFVIPPKSIHSSSVCELPPKIKSIDFLPSHCRLINQIRNAILIKTESDPAPYQVACDESLPPFLICGGTVTVIEDGKTYPLEKNRRYLVSCAEGFDCSQVFYEYLKNKHLEVVLPPVAWLTSQMNSERGDLNEKENLLKTRKNELSSNSSLETNLTEDLRPKEVAVPLKITKEGNSSFKNSGAWPENEYEEKVDELIRDAFSPLTVIAFGNTALSFITRFYHSSRKNGKRLDHVQIFYCYNMGKEIASPADEILPHSQQAYEVFYKKIEEMFPLKTAS